jgi:hypothetical protein
MTNNMIRFSTVEIIERGENDNMMSRTTRRSTMSIEIMELSKLARRNQEHPEDFELLFDRMEISIPHSQPLLLPERRESIELEGTFMLFGSGSKRNELRCDRMVPHVVAPRAHPLTMPRRRKSADFPEGFASREHCMDSLRPPRQSLIQSAKSA